jgi:hypothetical protein
VAGWLIGQVSAVSPTLGSAFDAAYRVKLSCGTTTRELVVEFAAPSAVASSGYAEEIARRFLSDEVPPQHVVVEIGGGLSVRTGPLSLASDETTSSTLPEPRELRRARSHRRG